MSMLALTELTAAIYRHIDNGNYAL